LPFGHGRILDRACDTRGAYLVGLKDIVRCKKQAFATHYNCLKRIASINSFSGEAISTARRRAAAGGATGGDDDDSVGACGGVGISGGKNEDEGIKGGNGSKLGGGAHGGGGLGAP